MPPTGLDGPSRVRWIRQRVAPPYVSKYATYRRYRWVQRRPFDASDGPSAQLCSEMIRVS